MEQGDQPQRLCDALSLTDDFEVILPLESSAKTLSNQFVVVDEQHGVVTAALKSSGGRSGISKSNTGERVIAHGGSTTVRHPPVAGYPAGRRCGSLAPA